MERIEYQYYYKTVQNLITHFAFVSFTILRVIHLTSEAQVSEYEKGGVLFLIH